MISISPNKCPSATYAPTANDILGQLRSILLWAVQFFFPIIYWQLIDKTGSLFDTEDGGDMFLWNVGWLHETKRDYIPEEKKIFIFLLLTTMTTYRPRVRSCTWV
jgi:hypothetical protein